MSLVHTEMTLQNENVFCYDLTYSDQIRRQHLLKDESKVDNNTIAMKSRKKGTVTNVTE
jgi:hypothetical protein